MVTDASTLLGPRDKQSLSLSALRVILLIPLCRAGTGGERGDKQGKGFVSCPVATKASLCQLEGRLGLPGERGLDRVSFSQKCSVAFVCIKKTNKPDPHINLPKKPKWVEEKGPVIHKRVCVCDSSKPGVGVPHALAVSSTLGWEGPGGGSQALSRPCLPPLLSEQHSNVSGQRPPPRFFYRHWANHASGSQGRGL